MHGFGWNVACRQLSGHGRTDQHLSPIQIIVWMPEPDCFLRYRIGYGTLQPCLCCQRPALLHGILCRKIPRMYGSPLLERAIVFKWFYSLTCRKTFVGGKCAPPNALLVWCKIIKVGHDLQKVIADKSLWLSFMDHQSICCVYVCFVLGVCVYSLHSISALHFTLPRSSSSAIVVPLSLFQHLTRSAAAVLLFSL